MVPTIHLLTFGCQMNKYDSELVLERFIERGYGIADSPEEASVVLINTCSVREHAEERVLSRLGMLKRLKRTRPDLVVGVMGCMAQRMGAELVPHSVDLVCGTREFPRLPDLVERVIEGGEPLVATDAEPEVVTGARAPARRRAAHAFVAVMRGCDLNCAFCIVPSVRGRVRSRPAAEIEAEIRELVHGGVREVTLLGQTVNSYGFDAPGRECRLSHLLEKLSAIEELTRIHLVTSHPAYLGEDLIEAIAVLPKVSKFLPLPAQSGSDEVLKRMKRGYTTALYRERVQRLRAAVPEMELSSDWIVGFPGESDADFERSVDFLREMAFLYSFVFKYSPRPGTRSAEKLEDDVPAEKKRERNQILLAVQEEVSRQRMGALVGREIPVLVEGANPRNPDRIGGRSPWGHNVGFDRPAGIADGAQLAGTTVRVQVLDAGPYGVSGELLA